MTLLAHLGYAVLIVLALLGMMALGSVWAKNIFRAGDKTVAAVLGFSGFYSLSAECGAGDSRLCRSLRLMIDLAIGGGHCARAAKDEGLLTCET